MKPQHLALATLLCALAACSSLDSDDGDTTPASTAPPPTSGARAGTTQGDAIPSQAEFDAQATKSINQQNADAEFEKLKKEIEDGG